jgi:hypothetical protein
MNKAFNCSLALAVFTASAALSAEAATDAERIRLLEQQLEQQKTIMQQQQRMLEAMDNELKRLKAGQPAVVIEEQLAVEEKEKMPALVQSDRLEGYKLNLYGHMQLDAIYDFKRVDPTWESTLRPSTIPIEDGEFGDDGVSKVSVKQTQLGFRGEAPTPWGQVKTWFEFDFFGTGSDAGDTKFNLRHAWAEVGGLGFGQTNSNFMDISIFPNVVDWWGPSGMAFNRNPQVRYTWFMDKREFAVALEEQNGSFNTGIFGDLSPEFGERANDKSAYPDLTAHWRSEFDWGHYQIAGVIRQLEFETRGTPNNKPDGDDLGWGFNLTSVINSFGRDQIKLGLVYGEGIASFMNDGGINLAPDDFEAKAVEVTGITAYYDRYWSDHWSSSIGYSMHDNDPLNQQSESEFQTGQYGSVNLLYTPYPELIIGSEFLWGNHENVAGDDADDYRVQFTFKHKFGVSF